MSTGILKDTCAQTAGIQKVWDHWLKAKPNTRRRKLTAKHPEHRLIKKRLVDYQPEDLCKAIDGMFADTWSVEHDKLELGWALRQDDKHNNVDRFIEPKNTAQTINSPFARSLAAMQEWANEDDKS